MASPLQLQGVAFVTGAASGIGRGTVLGLAKYGVQKMALGDLASREADLRALADEVEAAANSSNNDNNAVECLVLSLDVTSEASVQAAVGATVARFGRLDLGVNVAGVSGPGARAPAVDFAAWRQTVDVNLHGVWLCQRAEISQMLQQERIDKRRGRGVIINVASMLGVKSTYWQEPYTAYTASKHAVVGLTRTDAATFASEGIRINALCPGYVETPMIQASIDGGHMAGEIARTPMRRLASVDEIVDCIAFMASPMSSYMTGSALVVDGGYTAG